MAYDAYYTEDKIKFVQSFYKLLYVFLVIWHIGEQNIFRFNALKP